MTWVFALLVGGSIAVMEQSRIHAEKHKDRNVLRERISYIAAFATLVFVLAFFLSLIL